jgi:hypothetical protein
MSQSWAYAPAQLHTSTWAQAMKKAKRTASVSNYMFVTPFLTTLLGYLLAGETPDRATIVGGVVIMAGRAGIQLWGCDCGPASVEPAKVTRRYCSSYVTVTARLPFTACQTGETASA